jgi:undecaprenyl-diphosphatase
MAWLWIAVFTLFRLVYAGQFLLVPDETNYWQWSRYLAWGYHDQAPLIAWTIKLATALFGHTETAVRLPSIFSMTVVSIYLVLIARRWVGNRAAWHTALLTQGILLFNVGGLLATADGLQAAAWAGATYHVARAYETDTWTQWLAGGLCFGCGLLGKYTMVLFLPGAFLYGLCSPRHRSRLGSLKPYGGVLLGFLMFTPVILWNANNNWNSLRHVAYIGGANDAFAIHLRFLGDFLASQAGLLSPLVFVLVVMAWWQALRPRRKATHWIYAYLALSSLTMFAAFAALSLHARVYGNWPGSAYLAPMILAAAFFARPPSGGPPTPRTAAGHRLWPWALGSTYLFTALVLLQVVWPVLPLPASIDRTATEIQGWDQLGAKAAELHDRMPSPAKTFYFGLRYQTASELAFYIPGQPRTVSINKWKRPNVYDYWWRDEDLRGWDAIGVTTEPDHHLTRLNQVFERIDPPVKLDIFRNPVVWQQVSRQPIKTFYLYRAYGFKGGLRWEPRDKTDIRAR